MYFKLDVYHREITTTALHTKLFLEEH